MTRLMDWGTSMYGGYYATVIESVDGKDNVIGIHADKLKELKEQLAKYNLKADANRRYDN